MGYPQRQQQNYGAQGQMNQGQMNQGSLNQGNQTQGGVPFNYQPQYSNAPSGRDNFSFRTSTPNTSALTAQQLQQLLAMQTQSGARGMGVPGMGMEAQAMGTQGMGAQPMGVQGMPVQGMGGQGVAAQGMGGPGMGQRMPGIPPGMTTEQWQLLQQQHRAFQRQPPPALRSERRPARPDRFRRDRKSVV